ncbi:hypothetical protein Q5P01_005849 [Channa striata]|uniref:Uncharacterized protein n=1 Tax=Channa striata TaxID=64152 RepID=A0AA88NDF0_CHASR|nr:hypothetical protein Q5P01_005849 [Channa striata]
MRVVTRLSSRRNVKYSAPLPTPKRSLPLWSANDPMARRSIGKSEYAKRVLMFGIAQPLLLSSRPFDVAFNLHNAV